MPHLITGLAAAPGIGIGPITVYRSAQHLDHLIDQARHVAATGAEEEWQHFLWAQRQVDKDLQRMDQFISSSAADIFAVHRLILHDRTLLEAVQQAVAQGQSAVMAVHHASQEFVTLFEEMDDDYFANRSADIRDVGFRLLAYLLDQPQSAQLSLIPDQSILLADDLTPSDTAQLDANRVVGIALIKSAPTAHTAILARSLGLPLVCSLNLDSSGLTLAQLNGLPGIVDGSNGHLLVEPDAATQDRYSNRQFQFWQRQLLAESHAHKPAITRDGVRIAVQANVNHADEVGMAQAAGADGIGLLRTEYLFQQRIEPPDGQDQFHAYQSILSCMDPAPLTLRLLDVGGDKPLGGLQSVVEGNPFLGVRGVRLLLAHPHLLTEQLTAIVELSQSQVPGFGGMRILIPMITTLDELRRIQGLLDKIIAQRSPDDPSATTQPQPTRPQIGVMIEVPSAALMADRLAAHADFLSIGTNDLAQYTLAADRTNSQVAHLVSPLDPAVLRLIRMSCQAGARHGIPVALCGELAGDPSAVPLLLGLGVTELSVIPPAIALVKEAVRASHLGQCRRLAEQALQCNSAEQVQALLAGEN